MHETKLSKLFDWLGYSVESLGPSMYRFIASVLPYMTPIPVAWLTMKSAESFLGFEPWVSFIFVFGLEGIGLWFTGLFVEAVVDFIRSTNLKSALMVVLFGIVVGIYVFILVNLNVKLKAASGSTNESLSEVVTLLCFLPLLTGVGNGYYKLKLDGKKNENLSKSEKKEERNQERQDKLSLERERMYLEHGMILEVSTGQAQVSGNNSKVSTPSRQVSSDLSSLVESIQKVSGDWRKFSTQLSNDQMRKLASLTPDQMKEIEGCTGFTYKTVSNWRAGAKRII